MNGWPRQVRRRDLLKAAGFGNPGAQPGENLLIEDGRGDPLGTRINDEPYGVRADVDDCYRFGGAQA